MCRHSTEREFFTHFCLGPEGRHETFLNEAAGLWAEGLQVTGFPVLPELGEVSHKAAWTPQNQRVLGSEHLKFLTSQLLIPRVSNSRVSAAMIGRGQEGRVPLPASSGEQDTDTCAGAPGIPAHRARNVLSQMLRPG